MDFHLNSNQNFDNLHYIDTPDYTFTLPDLTKYSTDFRKFLEKDLIECSTLVALEQAQRLNWWVESGICRKLWPLSTTGDGNCLLHAASLGMWGFHDRKLTLRAALHDILSKGEYRDALWRRWRFQQTRLNKQAGLVYSETEWIKEWEEIVAIASPEPRKTSKGCSRRRSVIMDKSNENQFEDSATYESLEEIHVLALAHVLKRTIVVVADTMLRDMNGEAMAPIPFGGVYLPFEILASDCHRGPLLLTYDMAHFSALVSMDAIEESSPALIPLTDLENVLIPIQFCIDPGLDFFWSKYDGSNDSWVLTDREHIALLREYLDIINAGCPVSPEEEIFEELTDEEFERKISETEIALISDENIHENGGNGKSKAAKQLQSVAKQFGSIGKSMSKKIKKNIGSITKIGSKKKNSLTSGASIHSITKSKILCAQLRAKRHEYQDEMIRNYLECAHIRYIDSEKLKEKRDSEKTHFNMLKIQEDQDGVTNCINAGCQNYATASTAYMCNECYEQQRTRESNCQFVESVPRYGSGKSKFYTQSDRESHNSIKRLPSVKRLNDLDQTLYLSNSTFFNDRIHHPTSAPAPIIRRIPIEVESDELDYRCTTASVFSPGNSLNRSMCVQLPPAATQNSIKIPSYKKNDFNEDALPLGNSNRNTLPYLTDNLQNIKQDGGVQTPFFQIQAQPCRTKGCMFYGSANSNFYCSKCCQLHQQNKILSDV